jgi:hypothetical protein
MAVDELLELGVDGNLVDSWVVVLWDSGQLRQDIERVDDEVFY